MDTLAPLQWHTEKRKINDLKAFDKNPRKLTAEQKEHLTESLKKFNLVEIPAIDIDGVLIAGHQRVSIMKALGRGEEEIDCRVPNRKLTEEEFKEYNLRSNKNTGDWDNELLASFGEDLLKEVGFGSDELDRLFPVEATEKDDDVPEVAENEFGVKRGDIWQLGRHRLMCGDSTNAGDVALLMDGKKASIAFTSPPYNLGNSIKLRGNKSMSEKGNAYDVYDDNVGQDEYIKLLDGFVGIGIENADYLFVNIQPLAGNNRIIWEFANRWRNNFCDLLIWDKGHSAPAMARRVCSSTFEMIFVFKKDNPSRSIGTKDFKGTISNIVRTPAQRSNEFSDIHGASFPVAFADYFINNFSNRDEIILDQFCGTGTTIISCEKSKRIGLGMELSELYCSVIIKRWQEFTGQKAERIVCGQ